MLLTIHTVYLEWTLALALNRTNFIVYFNHHNIYLLSAAALNCILHPHHVSLMEQPVAFQSLFHSFRDRIDPYTTKLIMIALIKRSWPARIQCRRNRDSFPVRWRSSRCLQQKQITVEWLQNQVLIVRGVVEPADTETLKDPFKEGLHNDLAPPKRK